MRLRIAATILGLGAGMLLFNGCANKNPGVDTKWEQPKTRKKVSNKNRKVKVAVITDEERQVIQISFLKKSGSTAVDDFILQSIRDSWPGQAPASSQIIVEVEHSAKNGFSEPKVLSVSPLMVQPEEG